MGVASTTHVAVEVLPLMSKQELLERVCSHEILSCASCGMGPCIGAENLSLIWSVLSDDRSIVKSLALGGSLIGDDDVGKIAESLIKHNERKRGARERALAFISGTHPRLGKNSILQTLPKDALIQIVKQTLLVSVEKLSLRGIV